LAKIEEISIEITFKAYLFIFFFSEAGLSISRENKDFGK